MIANSELKVSHHIDRSHVFRSAFASLFYTYISFAALPDEGVHCEARREMGFSID